MFVKIAAPETSSGTFFVKWDAQLQNTALWVASHHPAWTDIVIDYHATHLETAELSETEKVLMTDLMLNFCEDPKLQNFISFQKSGI